LKKPIELDPTGDRLLLSEKLSAFRVHKSSSNSHYCASLCTLTTSLDMNYQPITNVEQAIHLLRQCQPIHTSTGAVEYLSKRLVNYRLLSLYQKLFPEQFNKSTASIYSPVDRDENDFILTEKEMEFLGLVDEHLFPLPHLDYFLEGMISPLDIPVTPVGLGRLEDYELGYEELETGLKVLLPMSFDGRSYLEDYLDRQQQLNELWYWPEFSTSNPLTLADLAHPETINYKQLRHLCLKTKTPAKFFPLALKFIDLTTGNLWLDEPGGYIEDGCLTTLTWSYQNVIYLKQEYRKAQLIINVIFELINWLEKDLDSRFIYLLQLWNQASTTHQSHQLSMEIPSLN
jgi:hypothetical protein